MNLNSLLVNFKCVLFLTINLKYAIMYIDEGNFIQ